MRAYLANRILPSGVVLGMTRMPRLLPVAVLALIVVTMLVACGGKGGGY